MKESQLPDETLFRRVGLAAAMTLSNIAPDPQRWIVEPGGKPGVQLPDAQYSDENGELWAVEFDAGNYTFNMVDNKLSTFKETGYAKIIYAVTSPLRQRNIARTFSEKLTQPPPLTQWRKTE